jgi:hypothetical protein
MPPLAVAIATIAAAAASTGLGIYEATNQPGKPKLPTGPAALTGTQNAQQTAAVSQQLPTLQSMTGGSVSPEYAAQFGATGAGVANDPQATGNIQDAINKFFGLSATGTSGLTPASGGSTGGGDILSMLSKGKPPTPGGGGDVGSPDFVNSILNGDAFRGLVG